MKLTILILAFVVSLMAAGAVLAGHTPVTICHKPGTPAEHTITVDDDAVPAHLAHGDYLGPCQPSTDPSAAPSGEIDVPVTATPPAVTVTLPPTDTE